MFDLLERAAAPHLPASIDAAEAFETYIELAQTIHELRLLARMCPQLVRNRYGLSDAENARLLGHTATHLFSSAMINWPLTENGNNN